MRFVHCAVATLLVAAAGCEDLIDPDHYPVTGEWSGQYTNAGTQTFLDLRMVERSGGSLSGRITLSPLGAGSVQDSIVGTNRNLCVTLRSARDSHVYFRGSLVNPTWIDGDFEPDGANVRMAFASSPGPAYPPTGSVPDHCD
ncbi:hypothetical protein [Longimicrobium terrae]|uniref:Lipoprotein n=1 Tax=Longimicrobium terrae TaxID=1639882 RepID=A0A841GKB8_9BACT|nr:hypothetical protein [Longimicrobium terrae]MBB4634073.1 hypothetical protein [Longimicrobium terrae]MBB6069037.1 hypothetical protein [Longimicrobium terrae]NNC28213.1 hypothetical protein [Longimicrobium terrae]